MKIFTRLLLAITAGVFSMQLANAAIKLPVLVSDNMVLQCDAPIKIWGWANPAEKVSVQFIGENYSAKTNADGKWQMALKPAKAGGPFNMVIKGTNTINLKNILIGDVWFCAGQSNMVINMERVKEKYPDEVANANYPEIRNFFIPTVADVTTTHDDLPPGKWEAANGAGLLNFGAATYFFAKQIYLKYHIPVGIINSSVGGTPIEAWISDDGYKTMPTYAEQLAKFKDTAYVNGLLRKNVQNAKANQPVLPPDQGLTGPQPWYAIDYTPQGWHKFWLPGYWADQGVKGLNGTVWFRKEIDVPVGMAGRSAKLFMGRIIDADQAYVNGVLVGGTTYQYPPRRYTIPSGLLKSGKNIIVIKVINTAGKGGFVPDKPYNITAGNEIIDLRGDWLYQVGQIYSPAKNIGGETFSMQNSPTGLYNTMVAPAINYTIKGFIWYQGEANTNQPTAYQQLLPALIADWRKKWHLGDLPFLFVQLPNFMEVNYSAAESDWARLRENQRKSLTVPNTAMAVAIDAGEWNDIHPLDKKDVGDRLALAAGHLAYADKDVVYSGPLYQSFKIEGNKIILSFTDAGSGLTVKGGGDLRYFAIAGADKKYVWAKAKIEGNKVVVWNDDIANPVSVRYAWADNPEGANLYNQEGLPASPFETYK
jgi:sialate O-acetylesterase